MKLFGFISSFICPFLNRKTEFNEITERKKMYKELDSLPNQRREILSKIQDEVMAVQKNVLEDCPVCLEPQNLFSSEGVLLNCGHEVCRTCFMDQKLKQCPKFCKEKKEYKTKFEELIEKENLENALKEYKKKLEKEPSEKGHKKIKIILKQNMKIEENEYKALKYILAQQPTKEIARLLRHEMKKCDVTNNKKQINIAVQKLRRNINIISRYLNSSWLFNHFDLDGLVNWKNSAFYTQNWITYSQLAPGGHSLSEYFTVFTALESKLTPLIILLVVVENLMNIKLIPIRFRRFVNYPCSFYFGIFVVVLLGYELWRDPGTWWKILFGILLSDKLHFQMLCTFLISGVTISCGLFIFPGLEKYFFPAFLSVMFMISLGVPAYSEINKFWKDLDKNNIIDQKKVKKKVQM